MPATKRKQPGANMNLSKAGMLYRLRHIVPIIFSIGFVMGLPTTVTPSLQTDTFGARAFLIAGLFAGVKGFGALLYSPLIGASSDIRGRKYTMIITTALSAVPSVVMAITGSFWAYSATDPIFGMFSATLSIALAWVTDTVAAPLRTEALGVAMASISFGFGIGPAVGTALGATGAFQLAAVFAVLTIGYTAFLLPRRAPRCNEINMVSHLDLDADGFVGGHSMGNVNSEHESYERSVLVLRDEEPAAAPAGQIDGISGTKRKDSAGSSNAPSSPLSSGMGMVDKVRHSLQEPNLRYCALLVLFDHMAEQMLAQLLLLYLQKHLGFTSDNLLALMCVLGLSGMLCLLVILGILKDRFGTIGTLRIALVANSIAIGLYAFVNAKWQAIVIPTMCMFGIAVFPCASSLAAMATSQSESGAAQGIVAGARMVAEGLSPAFFGAMFNIFDDSSMPGAPFLIASVFVLVGLALSFKLDPGLESREDQYNIYDGDLPAAPEDE